jgi:hypothetical protein
MSIESPLNRPLAPEALKDVKLATRPAEPERDGMLEQVADAANDVLAPLDHFKDRLAGDLNQATRAVEAKARKIPVLAQLAQFGTGAVSAVWSMAEGTYQTVRHPVQTVKGLWSMASHVPVISPMWWVNGVKDGFGQTLEGDKVFWKAVGQGFIAPYAKDWNEGRYFAVAGRAAVDVGTLYVGLKNAKAAFDGWRANRASAAVDDVARMHPEALDDGLRAATMGDEARVVGSVVDEGVTVVKASPADEAAKVATKARPKAAPKETPMVFERDGRVLKASEVMLEHKAKPVAARAPRKVQFEGKLSDLDGSDLARLQLDKETFRRLRQVGPKRMKSDPALKPHFERLTASVDMRVDSELTQILGIQPKGDPKMIHRAAAKLEGLQDWKGPGMRLDDLDDLARGRIDLPDFNPAEMKGMLKKIRTHFGDQNLMVNNYLTQGKPFYRGRLHIKIKDRSGLWYELQIGPKQLSTFYDSPFKLGKKVTNIHDAVYKGVMRLDDEAAAILGKGDKVAGQARLADALDLYVDSMNDVMAIARQGKSFNYMTHTAELRKALNQIFKDLPVEKLPIGLQ